MRIEKIEFEQLTKNVINDKVETYFIFVRIYIDVTAVRDSRYSLNEDFKTREERGMYRWRPKCLV